jgi:hypothetical protein
MSGHKEHGRHHRATGGENEAEMDLKSKPETRTNAKNIDGEAEERKRGGRAERKHGGHVEHHRAHKGKDGFGPEHEGTHKRHKRRNGGGVESKEYDSKVEGKKKQDGEGFGFQNGPATKRRAGGKVKHHEAKHAGHIHGEHHMHSGRKPRKSGGQAVAERNPFSTAAVGRKPTGRTLDMEMDGDTVKQI